MSRYAVIDFETTGLFPGGHDRVVEIAVVHVGWDGVVTGAWETLVNPGRDLGPQHIHQIRAVEILEAPTFADIAPSLLELLAGRTLVAHNASFDLRFLNAELARLSVAPVMSLDAICTMRLATEFLPGSGRALVDCCAAYDIELVGAHRASVDALATAQLLQAYMRTAPDWLGWGAPSGSTPPLALSALQQASSWRPSAWRPRGTTIAAPESFLERITVKMPEFSGPAEQLDYLALLDRCLLDRHISAHESAELVTLAEDLGISRATCEALHLRYFDDLTEIAWEDGILTTEEITDLAAVASLLSIPAERVVRAMQDRPATVATELFPSPAVATFSAVSASQFSLAPGDLIVLTGAMLRPRDDLHRELISIGYVPWAAVTKKVRLLVAADADSLSGKARKARSYGIPVVDEAWLERMLREG